MIRSDQLQVLLIPTRNLSDLLQVNPWNDVATSEFGYRLLYFTQNLLAHFSYKRLVDFLPKFLQILNILIYEPLQYYVCAAEMINGLHISTFFFISAPLGHDIVGTFYSFLIRECFLNFLLKRNFFFMASLMRHKQLIFRTDYRNYNLHINIYKTPILVKHRSIRVQGKQLL